MRSTLTLLAAVVGALVGGQAIAQRADGVISTAAPPPHAGPVFYGPPPLVYLPRERMISPLRDTYVPDDGKPHGEVSASVGTGGMRAVSGCVTAKPLPGVTVGVAGGYYEGPLYGAGYAYGYGPGYNYYGPDPVQMARCGSYSGGYVGEKTEVLKPLEETPPPAK